MGDHVLFFYGTLMAPQILSRVIHGSATPAPWQTALLQFHPAILHGYRRHRVRGVDYPGIIIAAIPAATITETETETTPVMPAASVLGTLVSGLTNCDLHRLDIFEGSEYVREKVKVRILRETLLGGDEPEPEPEPGTGHTGANVNANRNMEFNGGGGGSEEHLREVLEAARAEFADEAEEVDAVTYVWVAGRDRLEDAEWDFEAFKRDKMAWWVNADERDW